MKPLRFKITILVAWETNPNYMEKDETTTMMVELAGWKSFQLGYKSGFEVKGPLKIDLG